MIWKFEPQTYGGRELYLGIPIDFAERTEALPALVVHDGDMLLDVFRQISEQDLVKGNIPLLLLLPSQNRMDEYAPWKAPGLNAKEGDFAGGGDKYLQMLEEIYLPWLVSQWHCDAEKISSLGYSLGGLISFYGATKQNCWDKIISLCGSFWFKDWISYLEKNPVKNPKSKIFILAGEKESKSRNPVLRTTVDCARKTAELAGKTNPVKFVLGKGGHHNFLLERHVEAMNWLCSE